MGSNVREHIKISGSDAAECSETTVEIKIKTLDSQTFTMRVHKRVPVPELKEQIASVTGVLSEQQRLICRGKVLKDDQLLSAYHVEDGHTLHLVVRQPIAPLAEQPATDPTSSTGQNPSGRISPGMVVGTFNISEQGDGAFPDLNRIVSAVLNSFGVSRFGSGTEGIDLNQPPLERLSTTPGLSGTGSGTRVSSRLQSDQSASVAVPVEPLQPPIIPDSLTTLLQYVSHLRQEFPAYGQSANAQNGSGGQEIEAAVNSSEPRGLLTPESLAGVMSSARQLLVEQASERLSLPGNDKDNLKLAMHLPSSVLSADVPVFKVIGLLEYHSRVTDPLLRSRIQSNAIRSGALIQNLGALLLELGRAIMTLRMGQSPAEALVNAGPSVFISSTGPNPIMVQPLPFQPGASFGTVPVGTVQHGPGLAGNSAATGFLPRNIDIRIRAGSLFPRREPTATQSQGQTGTPSSTSVNSGQQDTAAVEPNSRNRDPQVRAIPIRTVVAAVPASVGRSSDSSRGSIGILYPVLARVQHLSSGSSNNARSSQASDQIHDPNGTTEHSVPGSSAQAQHVSIPGGNGSSSNLSSEALNDQGFPGQIRGLEQLLSSIFPGGHILSESREPSHPASAPSQTEGHNSQESASVASEEGVFISNILRQIMPVLSENTRVEENRPSTEGANSDETQADDNRDQGSSRRRQGSQSQASLKRQRRE